MLKDLQNQRTATRRDLLWPCTSRSPHAACAVEVCQEQRLFYSGGEQEVSCSQCFFVFFTSFEKNESPYRNRKLPDITHTFTTHLRGIWFSSEFSQRIIHSGLWCRASLGDRGQQRFVWLSAVVALKVNHFTFNEKTTEQDSHSDRNHQPPACKLNLMQSHCVSRSYIQDLCKTTVNEL